MPRIPLKLSVHRLIAGIACVFLVIESGYSPRRGLGGGVDIDLGAFVVSPKGNASHDRIALRRRHGSDELVLQIKGAEGAVAEDVKPFNRHGQTLRVTARCLHTSDGPAIRQLGGVRESAHGICASRHRTRIDDRKM